MLLRTIIRLLAAAAILSLWTSGYAQVDTSEWLCESCPFEQGYRADYEAGATYVSDEAARFGNATGYDEKGAYANLDGEGRYVKDGYWLDWYAEDLGLDSRVAVLEGGRQGSYGYYLDYRELPYRLFDTSQTIFSPSAPDTLNLPASWVQAGTTQGFTQLDSSLYNRNIESDRQTIGVGGDWLPSQRFRIYVDYDRQNRDGVDIMSGSSFTQSSLMPRFIDYETDQIDVGVQYATKQANLTLAYYGSFFDNKNSSMTWDTPFTTVPGAEQLRMAQEPDNEYQQVSLSGTYYTSGWDTVFAASAAIGQGKQNDSLLPYTINPNINAGPLPRNSLDGKVDTSNYALTITSKPTATSRLKLAYRYDERDNATTQADWTRVIVDLVDSGDPEANIPYSFKRSRLNLSGEVRVWDDWRLSAGYDRTDLDRDFQEVAEQTEDTGWGQVRWQPTAWFDLRAKAGTSKRDVESYNETVAITLGQNPLMRKYNLAYRYRAFGEFAIATSMREAPVSFSLTALLADDNYTQSVLGMTDSTEVRLTADVSWAISERTSTYLIFGTEQIEAGQQGSEQFSDPDWSATHDDQFNHIGVGFLWREIADKLDIKLDYTHGDGKTKIRVASQSGGHSGLPELKSNLDSLRLEGTYRWSDRWDATMDVRYEGFSTEDWALNNVNADTIPTILTMGADPYDYNVWAVGIGFRYKFGGGDIALIN